MSPAQAMECGTKRSTVNGRKVTMPTLLFAYGTLAPSGPEAAQRHGWDADQVRGRLFDLGPYPALVGCGDPSAEWVEGYVRRVDGGELLDRLDAYEGVEDGLYRRIVATTRAGRLVWVYEYAWPLPRDARGPLPRWDGPRRSADVGLWSGSVPRNSGDEA